MFLDELISALPIRVLRGQVQGVRICDLTEDSRTVVPGSLFFARAGLRSDGKAFVRDALAGGAVAVLCDSPDLADSVQGKAPVLHAADVPGVSAALAERFFGEPSRQLQVVGVTGTNGKTTITSLLWQMLNHCGRRCGLIGTVMIDDCREVGPASMTTPPALEISRSLASMVEAGAVAASMEISSHALDQGRADALRIQIAVFTNLTGDHLDYHKTMDAYAAAKARLFSMLAPSALGVVNADDPWTPVMLRECKARVLRCSAQSASADAHVEILSSDMGGMTLCLRGPWGEVSPRVGLIGGYNAMNVLQAVACAHQFGLNADQIHNALQRAVAPPGRLERVGPSGSDITVFVDYAHSDDSLRSVLATVGAAMPGRLSHAQGVASVAGSPVNRGGEGRLWAVFGCGGDKDRTKRPRMGRAAAELADAVMVTSDNPRTERPGGIIDEVLEGIPAHLRHKVTVQADRAKAIALAIESASPGDVVVIAGKGHETEQILSDGKGGTMSTHFDDREVAGEALARRMRASHA